ncbi:MULTISPECIES: carbohydrate binding domain-containing protein [Asticcacaulis]|uniref:carbohydrate binding domain-containing protein n=1 Tax=Asticcacaulis TaxID=76890 RepID=UPI001AE56473|nr:MULTISPECIES: carbohydrate binding domain-containing protein [Asticcacaulis]MBP2161374.1 hypothetical protein [Asticcacaulis solisilvae]MDR6802419.1 hypothetical protein [Asticcacaulis sp. BE141]
MKIFSVMAAAAMLILAPVAAHADDDITKHLVSNPNVGSYQIYGSGQTNKKVRDAAVQGGQAIEIKASGNGNPWDGAAQVEVNQKVTKGDKLVCAIWLKARSDSGTVRIPGRLQVNEAPYRAIGETSFDAETEWKMYTLETTADADYEKGKLVFVVHLNTGKQVIHLGPAFVLNMTRTY